MPVVELLHAGHDRASFDCGKPALNEFLQKQARQNADRHLGVTYVVIPEAGAARSIGIFALVLDAIDADARSWYLSLAWGFQQLKDSPNHLFLPVATIRRLHL